MTHQLNTQGRCCFGARLRDQVDLDTLTAEVPAVVDQTMPPTPGVAVGATPSSSHHNRPEGDGPRPQQVTEPDPRSRRPLQRDEQAPRNPEGMTSVADSRLKTADHAAELRSWRPGRT